MLPRTLAAVLLSAATAAAAPPPSTRAVPAPPRPSLAGRAVWSHPRDAGTTEASVAAFAE